MAKRKAARQAKKAVGFAITAIFAGLVAVISSLYGAVNENVFPLVMQAENVKAHVIDVGQGDATLLEANGLFALIDTGERAAKEELMAYLNSKNVKQLEYFIVTHGHADHIGNAQAIIEGVKVKQMLLPQFDKAPMPTSTTFERMLDAIANNNIPVQEMKAGDSFALGGASIEILADGIKGDEQNNISPFIRFSGNGFSFLCSGDAEYVAEQELLDSAINLKADVFKAAHHGSKTSNSKELLKAISPELVAISCMRDNSYGHPHKQALDSFKAARAICYLTYESGDIVFERDNNGDLRVTAEKES